MEDVLVTKGFDGKGGMTMAEFASFQKGLKYVTNVISFAFYEHINMYPNIFYMTYVTYIATKSYVQRTQSMELLSKMVLMTESLERFKGTSQVPTLFFMSQLIRFPLNRDSLSKDLFHTFRRSSIPGPFLVTIALVWTFCGYSPTLPSISGHILPLV